ncbi:MAG: lipoyl synthase [Bacteroidales bacterium]
MEDYRQPKPEWLKVRLRRDDKYHATASIMQKHGLNTICVSGKCPNIKECWMAGTATFMILGDICTRSCKFCNTKTGRPLAPDPEEPRRVAQAALKMHLKHVVVTSVDRDDLPDLGASHWVATIQALRELLPHSTIEVLIPDFQGKNQFIDLIIEAQPHIIGHNVETVRRLTPAVRSRARYDVSLAVLQRISSRGMTAKSGLMLGLGETHDEVLETLRDLKQAGCSIITIGQYLRPTPAHFPVAEYIRPEVFEEWKNVALELGFVAVESGPLVRSSYHAAEAVHVAKS